MSQLVSLIGAVIFVAIFRKAIEKAPVVFYVLAILVTAAGIYFTFHPAPQAVLRSIIFAIQKGHVGFAFLAIVMFIGAFSEKTAIRQALNPIRAELSIIGGILMVAHFVPYLASYIRMFASIGSLRPSLVFSLIVAFVILGLLVVLVVTSFRAIKKNMSAKAWKNVQLLAYPFFILIYFHLLGYMLVPAQAGRSDAIVAIVFYTVLFVAYIALRLFRHFTDKKEPSDLS